MKTTDNKTPRRLAALNAAARRMGFKSWSDFGTAFTKIILPQDRTEPLDNDEKLIQQMFDVLENAKKQLLFHKFEGVDDINQILVDFPRKGRGGGS